MQFKHQFNDGGRAAAGWKGTGGDCVARAIAIASGRPYKEVYDRLAEGNSTQKSTRRCRIRKAALGKRTALHGIDIKSAWCKAYLTELGFRWVATMTIGSGCQTHLRKSELPTKGRMVVRVSKHVTAVVDGVLHDTYNCTRGGSRCVYGYWIKDDKPVATYDEAAQASVMAGAI